MLPAARGVRRGGYHDLSVADDLTPEQRAAVTHPGGPAIVLAGAGAGKTRVLCRRLAWLVEQGASPDEILALTFTREAAVELRARAEEILGTSHETLRVTTFHAYALDVARIHGAERGLLPDTTVARPEDRTLMMLDRLGELDLRLFDLRGDRVGVVDELVRRIDACRDQLVTAEAYRGWAEAAVAGAGSSSAAHRARRQLEFARVFEAHDRWLAEDGREDFGLSIVRVLDLLRAHPDRRAAVQEAARHVLVDEFQDTNHAQAELLYVVAGGSDSLMVVGDDDQGIYRFRGASSKNITDFRRRFPDAADLRLERNHRSTQAILDAASAVVAPIADRAAKTSVALPEARGPAPAFWRAPDPDGQARAVVDRIVALAEEGVPLEEQAVLMRAVRLESRPLVDALERAGVPHQVRGGIGLFERREVRAAVAWLRAACDPSLVQDHLRVGADPRYDLPWGELADAVTSASAAAGAVTGALTGVAEAHGGRGLAAALADIGRAAAELPPADALRAAIDRSGPALGGHRRRRRGGRGAPGRPRRARAPGPRDRRARPRPGRPRPGRDAGRPRGHRLPRRGHRPPGADGRAGHDDPPGQGPRVRRRVRGRHDPRQLPGQGPRRDRHPRPAAARGAAAGPRRPRGGVAAPGVRRHDPRPPPPGALHPRRRRERRRAGARRPSSRRPARPWGPRSPRSGRPPSGPCWRPWARRGTPPSARRCARPGRWPRAPTTRRPSARPRPTPPPRWSPRGRR